MKLIFEILKIFINLYNLKIQDTPNYFFSKGLLDWINVFFIKLDYISIP